ncbi:MAG TPA: N-acetylneuraminate synthase family protein [Syntrophobacteraceae bacterium]|nr:N-acetylneuraminate synthase family protein [Syntrophobacteraceae bacterium]
MITLKALEPFFVFEMANNHMGLLEHGRTIIGQFANIAKQFPFTFGFKLQYRQLDTFIHPAYTTRTDFKYVKRFTETRLAPGQYRQIVDEMKAHGFVAVCTPFDEASVDLIEEHGFDIIKVASCSFTDWPLLEKIVRSEKPIIASTAGVALQDIDKVVSFFAHRRKDFAIMHCVAQYPTPAPGVQLNQIDVLKARYPDVRIGYSTHEDPENVDSIKIAVAKGATIFEKHVGVLEGPISLNDYSATPQQAARWLRSAQVAFDLCGVSGRRADFTREELSSLRSLQRGIFAKRAFNKGELIPHRDLFAAIPTMDEHITANDLSKYAEMHALEDIEANAPLLCSNVELRNFQEKVYEIVQEVKGLLRRSGVTIPSQVDLEISHHYGIDRFHEYGLTMMTVVNRMYCKKLIALLPGQKHPTQYHKQKEETFHVLYGDADIELNGSLKRLKAGETITVERGVHHYFGTHNGAIIEEISSTHYADDSFYLDPAIMANGNRKTLLTYWFD